MTDQSPKSILIVDDDGVDIILVKKRIRKSNLQNPIYVAQNGLEAIEKLTNRDAENGIPWPFMILLDWNMPKMNGKEFLLKIRDDKRLKDSHVVVCSTSDAEADISDALQLGATAYIIKDKFDEDFIQLEKLIIAE